ncbi:CRISP/Allergen/PR-1 like protein [Argiope bruennichi]|uniref:CRISP/Allergen/PR-1 like protein n=1 Tax=Argiope bruennichi TaxID=94029 RepID=A0A8T0E216_ARGBR|nr:CRISP/Allergen/PR-1 like protein [Argiope bruennichi]
MAHHLITIVAVLFVAVVASNACYYKKFSPNHTGCKSRNPRCNIVDNRVSDDDKKLLVKLHNQYREKVAMGRESAAGGLPTASNMLEMVWDDELANIAQKHAETCEFEHDCNDCRRVDQFGVGQNLFMSFSSNMPSGSGDWEGMVKSFYSEVSKFRKEYISSFRFRGDYGHFSQIVWADSWRLGCGKVVFRDGSWYKTMISCNYGPA